MIKARFVRSASLETLRMDIRKNINRYREKDFLYLSADSSNWFESGTEIDNHLLESLVIPQGSILFEAENCKIIYDGMVNINPSEARDERLWVYLTHTILLPYARKRWPIPNDDEAAISHIQQHFFARERRQAERDNAASRLWWMAHLCARVTQIDLSQGLEALLFRSDVRANLLERPTSAQSSEVFGAILARLVASFKGKQALFERSTFRRFMQEINSAGGYKLLDCMSSKQLNAILDDIVVTKLQLVAL